MNVGGIMNILIIEDDETISLSLKFYLEQENFQVMLAKDGVRINKLIEENTFDLVLLDINLPFMNGYDVFKEIKNIKDIPVIFLTANDSETSIVNSLDMGADDYITKPFKTRELLSRINTVLRRTKQKHPNIINIKNIKIDLGQAKVFKDNIDIQLTALEYKIFLTLVLNPDQVFSREKLLADIWDVSEEYVYDNTLTVYIKRIREKIETNPNKPEIILTVRGLGYKLGEV